jgi:hypothetical protein
MERRVPWKTAASAFRGRAPLQRRVKRENNPGASAPKKSNAAGGQPPPTALLTWISALLLSPLGGGMTASARQRSLVGSPLLLKPITVWDLSIPSGNRCGSQQPNPVRRAGSGKRPQRPGNQSRKRVSGISPGDSPSRITGCRWPYRKSSGKCRSRTFCMHTLSARSLLSATQNHSPAVQNLWTM